MKIIETRIKETLFNIKHDLFEKSKSQKLLINKEENEIFIREDEEKTDKSINKVNLKDSNLLNSSFKDIESTFFTSLDTLNNTNLLNNNKNIIRIKEKIE